MSKRLLFSWPKTLFLMSSCCVDTAAMTSAKVFAIAIKLLHELRDMLSLLTPLFWPPSLTPKGSLLSGMKPSAALIQWPQGFWTQKKFKDLHLLLRNFNFDTDHLPVKEPEYWQTFKQWGLGVVFNWEVLMAFGWSEISLASKFDDCFQKHTLLGVDSCSDEFFKDQRMTTQQ